MKIQWQVKANDRQDAARFSQSFSFQIERYLETPNASSVEQKKTSQRFSIVVQEVDE
jgi:hypothetical protein